jgi:O-antigen ligase
VWSAQNQLLALYGFVKCVELLGVGAVFYSRASRNAQTIFFAFLTSALMQGLIVLSQFILNHSVGGVFYYLGERPINLTLAGIAKIAFDGRQYVRPYGTFSHPNSMAGFYLLLFAYYFQLPYITRNRVFHSLFLLLCSILILISFSKTAIIGFTIIHFIQLFHRWDYYRDCVVCFISRILVVVIPSLIFIQGQGDPLSVSGRLGLLNNAFRIIKEFPLLGVGLRNYSLYQHTFFNDYQFFFAQPVHNIFLLLACEIGIPLTFYFGYLFLLLLKNKKVNFVLVAFLITGMVDHYWFTLQQNWLLLPLIFAMI